MHREVFAGRTGALLTVGEMPGVTVDDAVLFTDPARAEVDMVFQFEHVQLDQGDGDKWTAQPLRLLGPQGVPRALAGGPGGDGLEQPVLGQPRPAAGRVPLRRRRPSYRVLSAKLLGSILHLHRGTPYVYQGEELGMTNMPFACIEDFRDIESVNHHREAVAHGTRTRSRCSRP